MTPAEHYTELDLDAVRTRAEWYRANSDARGSVGAYGWAAAAINSADDVPALLAEVERLRAKLDGPCGSCHPCMNYRDETWRAAGRRPPHVSEWDELLAEVERLRVELDNCRQLNDRMAAELGDDRDLKPVVSRDHYGWPIDGRGRRDGPR